MNKGDVYLIENLCNGKCYIGQAKCYTIRGYEHGYKGRWKGHVQAAMRQDGGCWILEAAIRKYGVDNFDLLLLCTCDLEDTDFFEKFYIKTLGTLHPNGYNIRTGGKNGEHCEASRELMRQKKLGPNNHNYGKPRTKETKAKISAAKSGVKHHFYGKTLSLEHKLNLSKSHKKNDPDLPMYMVYVKPRPEHYVSSGYAILNHPSGKKKYFTSKKLTDDEKYNLAYNYLQTLNNEINL